MKKIILVTGGARSGKSRFAEKMADDFGGKVLYVATAKASDSEMVERISHHKQSRPAHWGTYEGYKNFSNDQFIEIAKKYEVALVDCLTVMSSNIILEQFGDLEGNTEYLFDNEKAQRIETKVLIEINGLMNALEDANITAIMVTNEVGMALVPEFPLGRLFRDIAGRVNQRVADRACEVYFCVSGIPMKIK